VSNSRIYGSLGLVPVFMIGLYVGWLILLFGAAVAYAFKIARHTSQEKQIEGITQRGREFIALRLMTHVGRAFPARPAPRTLIEMSAHLAVAHAAGPSSSCRCSPPRNWWSRWPARKPPIPWRGHRTASPATTFCSPCAPARANPGHARRAGADGSLWGIRAHPRAERQAASAITVLAMVNRRKRVALRRRWKRGRGECVTQSCTLRIADLQSADRANLQRFRSAHVLPGATGDTAD